MFPSPQSTIIQHHHLSQKFTEIHLFYHFILLIYLMFPRMPGPSLLTMEACPVTEKQRRSDRELTGATYTINLTDGCNTKPIRFTPEVKVE